MGLLCIASGAPSSGSIAGHDPRTSSLLHRGQRMGIAGQEPAAVGLFAVYRETMPGELRRFPPRTHFCRRGHCTAAWHAAKQMVITNHKAWPRGPTLPARSLSLTRVSRVNPFQGRQRFLRCGRDDAQVPGVLRLSVARATCELMIQDSRHFRIRSPTTSARR